MKLEKAIEIKEKNRHIGILCPSDEDFEADDLSIEALRRIQNNRRLSPTHTINLLSGETED